MSSVPFWCELNLVYLFDDTELLELFFGGSSQSQNTEVTPNLVGRRCKICWSSETKAINDEMVGFGALFHPDNDVHIAPQTLLH